MAREGSVLSFHDYPTPPKDLLYTSPLKVSDYVPIFRLRYACYSRAALV